MLEFEGTDGFRQRLVMATLSNRPCRIRNIRHLEDAPGLVDYEASWLRLLDKIQNGCKIQINTTGTCVTYRPGLLIGGKLTHDCGTARSIGYFLEGLMPLAMFGKRPLHITLTGMTNHPLDPAVDVLRTVALPLMKRFGADEAAVIKITKRGMPPEGGGEVTFVCPHIRKLAPQRLLDTSPVKRVRGLVYVTRMTPTTANRVADAARTVLSKLIHDVYIYTDHFRGSDAGRSPGFGISLMAETINGAMFSADCLAKPGQMPEELGQLACKHLLEEIKRGGCVDTQSQALCLLLMVLCPEDVSKVRLGKLSPFTVQYLRDIKTFFGTTFKITTDADDNSALLSCIGTGYINLSKKIG